MAMKVTGGFGPRIIVAVDFSTVKEAIAVVDTLDPSLCRLKIGKEMFVRGGPALVKWCMDEGFDVFVDLKFHDIPNTVAGACAAVADLGVWMLNIHASGGSKMMKAGMEALVPYGEDAPLVTGVTVLTSMKKTDLEEQGMPESPAERVLRLARLAAESGLDGVVCSPQEVSMLRNSISIPDDFILVTPGVRPAGSAKDDQKRVMTPYDAILAGSTYLVIGRPITGADNPREALSLITVDVEQAISDKEKKL